MIEYIAFGIAGKITIFLIQKFPLSLWLSKKWKFLNDLLFCDLCLGVWVYSALNIIAFRLTFYSEYSNWIGEILTGFLMSFVVHLISIGWKDKFSTIIIQ